MELQIRIWGSGYESIGERGCEVWVVRADSPWPGICLLDWGW